MKESPLPPASPVAAPPPPAAPPVAPPPPPPQAAAAAPPSTPAPSDSRKPTPVHPSPPAAVALPAPNPYERQRFALGVEYARMSHQAIDTGLGSLRFTGTHTRTLSGDQNGGHTAMVYQLGLSIGGDGKQVSTFGLDAHTAVRGAVAISAGGSQLYAQAGPEAHWAMLARKGESPFDTVGVGGRVETGVAIAYGPDDEARRIQVGVFAEGSTDRTALGVAVRAVSF